MTSWVPGSLAYCCLFPAVVPGCCNRQGPITKSPSEGETTGEKRTRLALSFHLHEKAQYNLKYDINHSLTLIPPYYRKKSKIFAQETYCLPIAQQTNQSFRIKEREKKEIICLCRKIVFSNFWNRVSVIYGVIGVPPRPQWFLDPPPKLAAAGSQDTAAVGSQDTAAVGSQDTAAVGS
jgi:hypothetical protein